MHFRVEAMVLLHSNCILKDKKQRRQIGPTNQRDPLAENKWQKTQRSATKWCRVAAGDDGHQSEESEESKSDGKKREALEESCVSFFP